ncbi:hypothetical protein BD289DRAFT_109473 [Coniella lustricola]|uniref:Secreted protein n=1 Tax=Coniella lustricola TaxID=2025994 RepID=A0A2T2ZXC3_9PEZI|nr:hypothetical protein BD289DRAFT_109473 [Coniella lustricola]
MLAALVWHAFHGIWAHVLSPQTNHPRAHAAVSQTRPSSSSKDHHEQKSQHNGCRPPVLHQALSIKRNRLPTHKASSDLIRSTSQHRRLARASATSHLGQFCLYGIELQLHGLELLALETHFLQQPEDHARSLQFLLGQRQCKIHCLGPLLTARHDLVLGGGATARSGTMNRPHRQPEWTVGRRRLVEHMSDGCVGDVAHGGVVRGARAGAGAAVASIGVCAVEHDHHTVDASWIVVEVVNPHGAHASSLGTCCASHVELCVALAVVVVRVGVTHVVAAVACVDLRCARRSCLQWLAAVVVVQDELRREASIDAHHGHGSAP